jgi:hypothetical protein
VAGCSTGGSLRVPLRSLDAGQRTPNAYYEVFDRRISLAGMR